MKVTATIAAADFGTSDQTTSFVFNLTVYDVVNYFASAETNETVAVTNLTL